MAIEIIKSLVLGGVQGISEFLPISSSGHLVILPYLLKWDYRGLSFDVALHFGTVIAIIVFFWKDWLTIVKLAFNKNCQLPTANCQPINYPNNLLWQILIASIPAALVGFLINDYVEIYLHSPLIIAANLIFFGLLLWVADRYCQSRLIIERSTFGKTLLVGIAQSIALIPGVSRSGITMIAGRAIGLNRKDSARFSFLLGTPAMVGAFLFEFKDISSEILSTSFFVAVLAAAFFGFIAIKYLLKYLEKGSFAVFAVYRFIIAATIITIYFLR